MLYEQKNPILEVSQIFSEYCVLCKKLSLQKIIFGVDIEIKDW